MFEERVTLAELEVAQGTSTKVVYLQTTLLDDGKSGLKLVLTDGEDAWNGDISENDLDKLSGRLKMEFNKFVTQTVSALTREGLRDITFEYQLKALPSDRMQLVWKKCVAADDIKFQLGHVYLEKQDTPSQLLCSMLSQCVEAISSLKKQIGNLEADNERLARDRNSAIKRLDKCVAAKEEVESDLFSKFVAILNSKKEKIRELEDDRENEVQDRVSSPDPRPSTSKSDTSVKKSSNVTRRNGQASPNSDNEGASYTVDTDEEAEETPPKKVRTTLKTIASLESSINLGDEEETTAAPAARRARRKAPAKKPSLSKPVLPKVTASPSTLDRPSSVRKSSLRKSGSGSSKGSVNTEDLLDQM